MTIKFQNNAETKELVIFGLGDIQLDVITARLKSRYNVSVDMRAPKIAYRETIKKTVQAEGKHKSNPADTVSTVMSELHSHPERHRD